LFFYFWSLVQYYHSSSSVASIIIPPKRKRGSSKSKRLAANVINITIRDVEVKVFKSPLNGGRKEKDRELSDFRLQYVLILSEKNSDVDD